MVSQESKAALNWTANTRESLKTQNCFYLLSPQLYNLCGTFSFNKESYILGALVAMNTGHFSTYLYKYSFTIWLSRNFYIFFVLQTDESS